MPEKKKKALDPEAALAAVKKEALALAAEDLATINVDIPLAVSISLGVIPHLAEHREQITVELPHFPIKRFDKLHKYTVAAYQAHILWMPPEVNENQVAALLSEASPLRGTLLSDAEALALRGLLDADAVAAIRAGKGNLDTANDLVALSQLLGANWNKIKGRTGATQEEVGRAATLGVEFLSALGVRDHGLLTTPDTAADLRRRTFTLFVRAYDEVRRAITYLRWHEGDADVIIPSLYKGRGGRGAAAENKTEEAKAGDAKAGDAKPGEVKAGDAKPGESTEAKPAPTDTATPKPTGGAAPAPAPSKPGK